MVRAMAEEKKEVKEVKKEVKEEKPKEVKPVEKPAEAKPAPKPEAKPEPKKEVKPVPKHEPKKEEKKEAPKERPKAEPKPAPKPQAPAPTPAAPPERKKRKKKKLKIKAIHAKAKKKTAVARASLKKGTGKFRVNKRDLNLVEPYYIVELIKEPLELAGEALVNSVNVDVNVRGGGYMAQAVATRGAIAKALLEFSKDKKLKEKYLKYDRMLLVDDSRFKEAKKPLGTGARKKKQSSKR
jgi:small subunit ribosomal protein S9